MDTHCFAFGGIGRALLTAAVLTRMRITNLQRKITQMRMSVKVFFSTLAMFTALIAGHTAAYGQNTNSQPVAQPASGSDIDQDIDLLRKDVRSVKKQLIAANLELSDDEAVKFWPIYDQYAAELAKINDTKAALIKGYAENYSTMTDEQAEAYVKGRAAVDESVRRLRLKYFPVFRRVLPGKTTAKFFQIEWRMSLMIDLQLASQMPLIQQ